MTHKKGTLFLLLFLLIFTLFACDSLGTTTSTTTNTDTITTTNATTAQRPQAILQAYVNSYVLLNIDAMSLSFELKAEVGDATVTWSSSLTEYISIASSVVIGTDGDLVYLATVNQPLETTGNVLVTITGTFVYGQISMQRGFIVTVIAVAGLTDAQKLNSDILLVPQSIEVTNSLSLPSLDYGTYSNIVISSTLTSYLSSSNNAFTVIRPTADTSGTLTVTITVNSASQDVVITILMKAVVISTSTDLFISEYVEGSSYNKYIEIYNGTGQTVDLSTYVLELYSNGSATVSTSLTLSGVLLHGDVLVISHASAAIFTADILDSTVINFNGDDAVVLKHNGVVIDSIGQVGYDPGTQWGTALVNCTINMTLVRKTSITGGDTNPFDVFNPVTEWIAYAIDTATYLGSHTVE